ncbi:transcriptional regulator [Corynebacterium sp. TA-R-1]|uniref:Transcriptional regulator n=1 Tax=Corynebacterium stercoris TaxID=2943490 RepID=A0ABT1FZF1_9CORY|nr:metalloregulator ArsR/SmtB family transcription factor [Corynebacterium stercoris]MCP1387101.1 transcriptional regulator [Corynebacterium stercoris]
MAEQTRSVGGDTRRAVMAQLLKRGPVSASELARALGISAAGVRRHLDILLDEGLAETCEPNQIAGEEAGRGRPAKHFRLTAVGRDHFGNSYDTLALEAVDLIKDLGGESAVRSFAKERIEKILGGVQGVHGADDVEGVIDAVAAALENHGYAASITRAGGGIQICQHHCPVSAVAAAHPELCDAEHEAISQLVGRHIQPLALIADGHGICTTNIPLTVATPAGEINERSGA